MVLFTVQDPVWPCTVYFVKSFIRGCSHNGPWQFFSQCFMIQDKHSIPNISCGAQRNDSRLQWLNVMPQVRLLPPCLMDSHDIHIGRYYWQRPFCHTFYTRNTWRGIVAHGLWFCRSSVNKDQQTASSCPLSQKPKEKYENQETIKCKWIICFDENL